MFRGWETDYGEMVHIALCKRQFAVQDGIKPVDMSKSKLPM